MVLLRMKRIGSERGLGPREAEFTSSRRTGAIIKDSRPRGAAHPSSTGAQECAEVIRGGAGPNLIVATPQLMYLKICGDSGQFTPDSFSLLRHRFRAESVSSYINPHDSDAVLAGLSCPRVGSQEDQADMAQVLKLQQSRTEADCTRAMAGAVYSVDSSCGPLRGFCPNPSLKLSNRFWRTSRIRTTTPFGF